MALTAIEYASNRALVTPGKIDKPPYEIKIDTLTLICRNVCTGKGRSDIIRLTECAFDETIEFDSTRGTHSGKYWKGSSVRSLKGTRMLWNPGSEEDAAAGELSIHLTGTVLQGVSLFELLDYLDVLRSYDAEMTEIHVALDDLYKKVPLILIEQAVDAGNISGAQNGVAYRGLGKGKQGHDTVRAGSEHSDKFLVCYNKRAESGDDYYGNRWEAKFRREYAQEIFQQMFECESPKSLATYLSGVVLGCVRFVDKSSGETHMDRAIPLPWYEKMCLEVAPIVVISPKRKKITLQDSISWVERQVLRRMGMLKRAMGKRFDAWLAEGMKEKVFNLSPVDEAMIEEFQQHEQQQQQQFEQQQKEQQQQQAKERAASLVLKPNGLQADVVRIANEMRLRENSDLRAIQARNMVKQWDVIARKRINQQ
jgi:DNA relaxase NicK